MSRSSKRDNSSAVSLFPFLAVLLCTMGGLVVLLVVVSHVSRQLAEREKQAAQERVAQPAPVDPDAEKRLQQAKDYLKRLQQVSEQATAELQKEQLRIAQIEEHVRKLQEEMALTLVEANELSENQESHYDDRAQAERELNRLNQLIVDTEKQIAELKAEQSGAGSSYAVMPYKGASGTRRQPIYIECREHQVLLQPEGVELTPDDFRRPLGVGNPLAAALRAAREHLVRDNPDAGFDPDAEPYPLILIRPNGIGAYYKVREAIGSWESDFGYEMVDADWNLEFPAPDPQLANVETQAIENARLRREALAQAAPSAFSGGTQSFAVDDAGGGSEDNPYDPDALSGHAGAQPGGNNADQQLGAIGEQGAVGSEGFATNGAPGGPENSVSSAPAGQAMGSADSFAKSDYAEGAQQGQGTSQHDASGAESKHRESEMSFNDLVYGEMAESEGQQQGQPGGGGSSGRSPQGAGAPASSLSGAGHGEESGAVASLNDKDTPDDVAIRRSVSVAVYADRLLVGKNAQGVPMPGSTKQHAPEFVAAVRKQIESWGLAGRGLYWRPVIKLDVRQGGEQRAREIESLLRRSGVDVEPIQTAAAPSREVPSATR